MLLGELEAKIEARRRQTRVSVKAWVVLGLIMGAVVLSVWARF